MPTGTILPSFRIQLGNTVLPKLVTVGKFDGIHPSIACATSADNLLIHSPHTRGAHSEHETRTINLNRTISALAAGDLEGKPDKKRDLLLIGSSTSLQGYDVENNSDIFFKEVPDGVNALAFGSLPHIPNPLAMVGGNCSLQGFNGQGQESFWTVTGDNVSALAFREPGKDGKQELIVGSEDFEIRIFASEEVAYEATESDIITGLAPIAGPTYGYSLANGTIGVYNNATRVWHAKSKHTPVSLGSFDINNDGVPELIAGWSSGRLEVRVDSTGFLIYKDKFNSSIAKLFTSDYRMDGRNQIIAVGCDGEVRGYLPIEPDSGDTSSAIGVTNGADFSMQESQLQALYDRKNELLAELRGLEKNTSQIGSGSGKAGDGSSSSSSSHTNPGMIPTNTKLNLQVKPNKSSGSLQVSLSTNNDTIIKFVLIYSDVLFDGEECMILHPKIPSSNLTIPLKPSRHVSSELLLKVIVGHRSSTQDHVFELQHTLPRFSSFIYTRPKDLSPKSQVTFHTSERVNRVVLWINQAFAIDDKAPMSGINLSVTSDSLHAGFISVKDNTPLIIKMGPENGGTITIRTDSMELAGDIIQDLCRYLKIDTLESVADFPEEMDTFQNVLNKVEDYNAQRLKMSAEIADSSNLVKTLVIKAEDARILNEMNQMAKFYSQLYDVRT